MSDWNCIKKLLLLAPPSTLRSFSLRPESSCIAFNTSLTWYAIDSSVALTRWALLAPRVRPIIAPLAYISQYGAPSPANAGTTYTPLVSFTLFA